MRPQNLGVIAIAASASFALGIAIGLLIYATQL